MVLRYRAEGTEGEDGATEVIPPKPGKLKPLDASEGRKTPESERREKRPTSENVQEGVAAPKAESELQPRPPAEPRPAPPGDGASPKVSPKVRQLQNNGAVPTKGGKTLEGEDSGDNTSGASTADTPHAEVRIAEAEETTDIAEAPRERSNPDFKDKRCSTRKSINASLMAGQMIQLDNEREYIEHLYRQAEQVWMWKEMDAKAADHLHDEEGSATEEVDDEENQRSSSKNANARIHHHEDVDMLGEDEEDEEEEVEDMVPKPSANTTKAQQVRRQSAFILQFAAPEEPPEKAVGGEVPSEALEAGDENPLKGVLTAKKVNHKMVREVLQSTTNLAHWLEVPVDFGPPLVPKALVCAVAGNDQKLVELLLEFKADAVTPYKGTGQYKGWVKPGETLLHSVHNRKGRFVGTMLADRLESIEKVLMHAQAAQGGEASHDLAVAGGKVEEVLVDDKLPDEEPEPVRSEVVGASGNTRVSVCIKSGGGNYSHTQGHPRDVYEIAGLLGDGDTSTCWEGWHIVTRVPVAIKAECKSDEVMIWEEITLMRKINHPNIVRLEETFETDLQVFMVLELCEGGRLFDSLSDKTGAIKHTARSSRMMSQLILSVQHLHSLKICHRDIQLENFLIEGGTPLDKAVVKLIDFTTAKEFGPGQPEMKTKICTPTYVAREILSRKAVPYTEKVDIWSLGVTYYVILCGAAPFVGETDFEVLKKVKKGTFKMEPAHVWADVPAEAIDLVKKMIVYDPEERLSADQVMQHPWLAKAKES